LGIGRRQRAEDRGQKTKTEDRKAGETPALPKQMGKSASLGLKMRLLGVFDDARGVRNDDESRLKDVKSRRKDDESRLEDVR
jgi:hypothetical protein